MNVFKYRALNEAGEKHNGMILADNADNAYHIVCAKNLKPISVSEANKIKSKIKLEEILMFFLHIDFQLKCGVKINEAIDNFIDQQNNKEFNIKLLEISTSLKNGESLGNSFKNSIFDQTIVGLLNSAEQTGNISEVIASILSFLKLKKDWNDKVKSVIAYPLFITFTAIIIMWFCITILGPQVAELIKDYDQSADLPLLTDFAINYLPQISSTISTILIIAISIFYLSSFSKNSRQFIYETLLKIPKIGNLLKTVSLWQFCKVLQMSLCAKLDFINAIDLSIDSIQFESIKSDFLSVKSKMLNGSKIAEAFAASNYLPPSILTALSVGEEGNHLAESMNHISDELYKSVLHQLENFGKFLSISLTFITGSIFIFILYSLFYPMYSYMEIVRS